MNAVERRRRRPRGRAASGGRSPGRTGRGRAARARSAGSRSRRGSGRPASAASNRSVAASRTQLAARRRDRLLQPPVVRIVDLEPRRHQRDRGPGAGAPRPSRRCRAIALPGDGQPLGDPRRRAARRNSAAAAPAAPSVRVKRSVAGTTRSRSSCRTMLRRTSRRSRVVSVSRGGPAPCRACAEQLRRRAAPLPRRRCRRTPSRSRGRAAARAAIDLKNSSSSTGP